MTETAGILSPPRLTGNPKVDTQIMEEYLNGLFSNLIVSGRVTDRLDAISNIALLTQTISDPPTKAEIEIVQAKINELITAAA